MSDILQEINLRRREEKRALRKKEKEAAEREIVEKVEKEEVKNKEGNPIKVGVSIAAAVAGALILGVIIGKFVLKG